MNISDLFKPVRFVLSRLTLTPEQYPDEYFVMEYQEYLDWMRARERRLVASERRASARRMRRLAEWRRAGVTPPSRPPRPS